MSNEKIVFQLLDVITPGEFEKRATAIMQELRDLATSTQGGGLFIQDIDCDGGVYSLNGIELSEDGHVRLIASMWSPNDLAMQCKLFREDKHLTSEFDSMT